MRKRIKGPKSITPITDQSVPSGIAANDAYRMIRDRLDGELPACIYVSEAEFLKLVVLKK